MVMYINGISPHVTGFRVLSVEGREPLSLDIENIENNTRDGAEFKRRRVRSRTIHVNYAIEAATQEEFAARYNSLKNTLYNAGNAPFQFSDEMDKVLYGTVQEITAERAGRTAYTGQIEINCADPFKYSTQTRTVTAVNGEFTVDYGGTYPAHPILKAQSSQDCGFYAFQDQNGHRIQVGNPAEQDQEEVPTETAQTMIDNGFGTNHQWATWSRGFAKLLYGYNTDYNFSAAADYIYAQPQPETEPDYYYGPAVGNTLASTTINFSCSFVHWFEPSGNQGGGFDFYINNQGGGNIAGVSIWRNKGGRVQWTMIVKGNVVKGGSYSLTDNPFKGDWRTQTITKSLDTVTFNLGGVTFSVTDPDLSSRAFDAANVTFVMYRQPGAENIAANNAMRSVLFYGFENTWADVANKIPSWGAVRVNTGDGMIYLNNVYRPDLGDVENDFEEFKLTAGENTVICTASDWVTNPSYWLTYREVFL